MSLLGVSKCSEGEEESFDVYYLEIEQRIMLLISEAEEEEEEAASMKKIERETLSYKNSNFNMQKALINPFTEQQRGYYGTERWNGGKKIGALVQWSSGSSTGCKRMPNYKITGRRGTGVFIPKSTAY